MWLRISQHSPRVGMYRERPKKIAAGFKPKNNITGYVL